VCLFSLYSPSLLGKESVHATLEAISREGLVPSMSEDEGTDSEAEDEDENGEVQEHSSGPMVRRLLSL